MKNLKKQIQDFAEDRDWEKYHSPKNLAIGLNVESSELLEIFLWLTEDESKKLNERQLANLKQEIGDVMIYLTSLAGKFDFDPIECAKEKIELNKVKYPAKIVKGSARKYTDYK